VPVEKLSTGIMEKKIGKAFQTMKHLLFVRRKIFFFLIRCPPITLEICFFAIGDFLRKNNCDVAISGDDWP
jgi:hypothetical protein